MRILKELRSSPGPAAEKSTLVAALARPDVTKGLVPECYLSAVAFVDESTTPQGLADLLAHQCVQRSETRGRVGGHRKLDSEGGMGGTQRLSDR